MPNILVTGAKGQLGSELRALSSLYVGDFYFTDKEELDITDFELLKNYVMLHHIDSIVNCAAYTAVDRAEDDEASADEINHLAVKNLAEISKVFNIKLVHISTDYVFDGTNCLPYTEDDTLHPASVYGKTKLDGEKVLQMINPRNSIIIRTSWVYSSYGNNFVKTILRLGKERETLSVVSDQIGTPTYARDLAKTILDILPTIQNNQVEIYHYSNEGVCSWYDFAKEVISKAKLSCKIEPIATHQYPTAAKRPSYSVLNKAKIKSKYNIAIPYWKDSLEECLQKMGEVK